MNFQGNLQKIGQVASFEYRRQVFNVRFWLALLGYPLMALALMGMLTLAIIWTRDTSPVGVVGPAGLNLSPPPGATLINTYLLYPSEEEARVALLEHKIQAYFVLSPEHPFNESTQLVYLKKPQAVISNELEFLLRRNLLADVDPARAERVTRGARVILQTANLEIPSQITAFAKMAAAFGAIYTLLLLSSAASGYMTNTISDERNNRVLEVLLTTVSHDQLLTGKVIGQLAVTLTQALVWGGVPALWLLLAQQLKIPLLGELFTGAQLLVFVVFGLLSLTLISVLLSTLAVTVMDTAEGQLASLFFNFFTMVPIFMYQSITAAPSGPVALVLTFFPFTSAATLLVRMSFSSVPAWQVLLSLAILAAATRAAFWLAGRMFWLALQERAPRKLRLTGIKTFFRRVWKPRHG